MKRMLFCALTAVALSASGASAPALAASDQPNRTERIQHWMADRETMMDARLGGLKAALKLKPDQNPLWEAFESAVRGASKAGMDDMRQMMENGGQMSPVERMDAMAGHMARRADDLKKVVQAAKPLYGSLDDTQKQRFGLLGGGMMMMGPGRGPVWEEGGGDAGGGWLPRHWME
jgi:zinc resistance-associated protein